jgi:hypothetical protein
VRARLNIAGIVRTQAILAYLALSCAGVHAHDAMPGMTDGIPAGKLGTVSFSNSCQPPVKGDLNRAFALMHSFWLDAAQREFEKVVTADPQCAIAYWGEATAALHLINGEPSPKDLALGNAALAKADAAREKSPREAGYIQAAHAFYDGYKPKQYFEHAQAYAGALQTLVVAYPGDVEAKVFYALALLAAEPPDDVTLENPKKAVAVLYPLLRQYPNHPGIAHYIIHASDNPQMAASALEAARRYALIAPAAPHALHMPSHIFARLGLWQDDIRSNLASKAAAENTPKGVPVGAENRLHAMEFLEYAYLQIGQHDEARRIVEEARTVKASDVNPAYPGYYTEVEARFQSLFAIETQDWAQAAHLQPIKGADTYSQGETLLAHAIAAGHLRNGEAGQEAAQSYDALVAKEPIVRAGGGLETLRDEIQAWADFARGAPDAAAGLLSRIAARQRKAGKGEVELPAGEMLAEMLLLDGKPTEALQQYQISLSSDPNRFNALLGAGRAAEQTGQTALAARYYRALLANCDSADGAAVEKLTHARTVVK